MKTNTRGLLSNLPALSECWPRSPAFPVPSDSSPIYSWGHWVLGKWLWPAQGHTVVKAVRIPTQPSVFRAPRSCLHIAAVSADEEEVVSMQPLSRLKISFSVNSWKTTDELNLLQLSDSSHASGAAAPPSRTSRGQVIDNAWTSQWPWLRPLPYPSSQLLIGFLASQSWPLRCWSTGWAIPLQPDERKLPPQLTVLPPPLALAFLVDMDDSHRLPAQSWRTQGVAAPWPPGLPYLSRRKAWII